MTRSTWKYLLVGVILTGALSLGVSQVDAHLWGRYYGTSVGYYQPYYASWTSDSYYGWYGVARPTYRVVAYRPWHWCSRCSIWCQTCACDSCACSTCGCLACDSCSSCSSCSTCSSCSSCTSVTSSTGSAISGQGTTTTTPQPAEPTRAPAKPQPSAGDVKPGAGDAKPGTLDLPGPSKPEVPARPTTMPEANNADVQSSSASGMLTIQVPEGSKVLVNGYETHSQGIRRQYLSSGLVPGKVYPYAVTVMIPRASDGAGNNAAAKWDTKVETVYLKAGDRLSLNFDASMKTILASSNP
jgi:uncharacterized protein (TIGR03000 family)